jgi:hypothetical protein
LDKPSDVIDDSIFAFDENYLYLGDESNVSVLKINDIKTINIDVDNTIYSQSWIATFNDKKVKFNVNDIQILPLLNSITYILNQYKDEKNNSIEISMSEKASGIIQSKDIWEKYLIKYSGSVENSLNIADDVSDGILVLGAFETGGISLASMAEKKLAVKAAKKLIVREVLDRASKHPIKFSTKAYMETRKLYPKILNLKGYTKEGIQKITAKSGKDRFKDVCGVTIRNSKYAGQIYKDFSGDVKKKYSIEGINFNRYGYPDFSPVKHEQYEFKFNNLTGKNAEDFKLFYGKIGGKSNMPSGYTIHHHQDGKTLQLIPTVVHDAVRHSGGASRLRAKNDGCPLSVNWMLNGLTD